MGDRRDRKNAKEGRSGTNERNGDGSRASDEKKRYDVSRSSYRTR